MTIVIGRYEVLMETILSFSFNLKFNHESNTKTITEQNIFGNICFIYINEIISIIYNFEIRVAVKK